MRALLLIVAVCVTGFAQAALKAEPWPRWQAHDESNLQSIDHSAWSRLLSSTVKPGADGVNRVAYSKVSAADAAALSAYLERLQSLPISRYRRAEQRAYWINLYNAETLHVVLDKYPVGSIRDLRLGGSVSALLFGGPWSAKLLKVEDTKLSLDDIEHRILRPIWQDPRTHYAVNCASIGCPNLTPEAYTPERMEALLDEGARAYVNHPRGAKIENGKLVVSSIYVWFIDDFGGSDKGILKHLRQYADEKKRMELAPFKSLDDNSDRYDWALNDAR